MTSVAANPRNRWLGTTKLMWAFLVIESLLCLAHVYWHLTWRGRSDQPVGWLELLDVRMDHGLFQWGTVLANLTAGLLGLRIARSPAPARRRAWFLVGMLFVYLAIDDALTVHEWLDGFVDRNVTRQELVHPWLLVMLPVFGVFGILAIWFLHTEFRSDQRALLLMWLAFLSMAAALLLEVVERTVAHTDTRLRGMEIVKYAQVLEEYLEMLAPVLLIYCFGSRRHRLRDARSSDSQTTS